MASNVLTILESKPPRRPQHTEIEHINIVPDPRRRSRRPDVEAINRVLSLIVHPEKVASLRISTDSRLTVLPRLDLFPNLSVAEIGARRIESYEPLSHCRKLEDVELWNYGFADLACLSGLELDTFRAARGRLETFDLSARWVHLQRCTQLRQFGDARVKHLTIDCCQRVDLDSLAGVDGMETLSLLGLRDITSLVFTRGCPTLRALTIAATTVSRLDLSELKRNRPLERLFLEARQSLIAAIAQDHPELKVTNGVVAYFRGESHDPRELFADDE